MKLFPGHHTAGGTLRRPALTAFLVVALRPGFGWNSTPGNPSKSASVVTS